MSPERPSAPGPAATAATAALVVVAAHEDLADRAAAQLIAEQRAALPDLGHLLILLPHSAAATAVRARLARHAGRPLLGPRILSLAQFAAEYGIRRALPAAECRLLLLDALRRYRYLFADLDLGQIADALYALFEELSLQAVPAPSDEDAFAAHLRRAYGARPLAALSREAQIVYRLWTAFRSDAGQASPAAAYLDNLGHALQLAAAHGERIECLGHDEFSRGERLLLQPLLQNGQARLWLQGRRHGRDGVALENLLSAFDGVSAAPLPAVHHGDGHSDGLDDWLDWVYRDADVTQPMPALPDTAALPRITLAEGPEHEARCVELAVREALLDGRRDIVVMTEDRRLARRLRALLERAGIALHDEIGWALSTSAAAATLDSWLSAYAENFSFRPLLDLLKSPFLDTDPAALQSLERDLVYRQAIESGLAHFRARSVDTPALQTLLARIDSAAQQMPEATRSHDGAHWLHRLLQALERLGLRSRLQQDAAGAGLLHHLETLRAALRTHPQRLRLDELRRLLERQLERANFVAPPPSHCGMRVRLLSLAQSNLLRCDVLILAAATRAQLPGAAPAEAFFNPAVRNELGLPAAPQRQALALARLRRVLQAAAEIRITYAPEQPGEAAQLAPWLEALASAVRRRGGALDDPALAQRAGGGAVEIADPRSDAAAPSPPPLPRLPAALLPRRISATAHQALLDCPYQFYVRQGLRLREEQAPDEDPDRSDYGERVHRILQAFVAPVAGLPAPFGPVRDDNRAAAAAHLETLALRVMARDLESRALAHVWLNEFRSSLPALLDWLAQRPALATRAEVDLEQTLDADFSLYGRADRLETQAGGDTAQWTVVDYKTGYAPTRAQVNSGEAVQLVHYALLDPHIARVEYLSLRDIEKSYVSDDGLAALRDRVGARLYDSLCALRAGAALPAFGEDSVCARCAASGLCRRDAWPENETPPESEPGVVPGVASGLVPEMAPELAPELAPDLEPDSPSNAPPDTAADSAR